MVAKPPKREYRKTMTVMLYVVAAVVLLCVIAFLYWTMSGKPIEAPPAPESEATIPGT